MDQSKIEKYLDEIPSVLINATKPLGDEKCWAVYITLLQEGGLRFNKIKEIYDAQPAEISRILKSLANAGLIAKKVRSIDELGDTEAAYYTPTTLGKSLIASLYRGLLPTSPLTKGHNLVNSGEISKHSQVISAKSGLQPTVPDKMQISNVGGFHYKQITASRREEKLHAK